MAAQRGSNRPARLFAQVRLTAGLGGVPMQTRPILTLDLLYHVVDHMAGLMLGAEHDNFRVRVDLYVVPGRPVKEIICFDSLLRALCIGCGELPAQDETPVRTLAQITF